MKRVFIGLVVSVLMVGCSNSTPSQVYKGVKVKEVEYNHSRMDADYKVTVEHEGNIYLFEVDDDNVGNLIKEGNVNDFEVKGSEIVKVLPKEAN